MNKKCSHDQEHVESSFRYALIAGISTMAIVALLVLVKSYTWAVSGSAAVLASLVDSFMDLGVSTMNLLVIRLSLKPADRDHRYGHGKAEGIAALFQSAFIAGIAVFLLLESGSRFFNPEPVNSYLLGVYVMIFSVTMSLVIVQVQKACMRRAPSLAVEADSAHYSSDILVNAGTIITLLALKYGAPGWIDPLFALAVAVYLFFTVRHIGLKAVDMLMDRELSCEIRQEIKRIILEHPQAHGIHDLRTRKIGMRWSISFDVEMNPDRKLGESHEYTREIEQKLMEVFPHAEIMIHMDPVGDPADSRHPHAS